MHLLEKKDYVIKKSSVPNAGKGIFCKRDIPAGTIITYNTIVKKCIELDEHENPTYHMTISYIENGKERSVRKFISDGNPKYFKGSQKHLAAGAHVNEASQFPPNCIFVTNPFITKEQIYESYKTKNVLPSCFLVVPFELKKGQELFTMYGSCYNDRNYKQWRDRAGYRDRLIEEAHHIMNNNQTELEWLLFTN